LQRGVIERLRKSPYYIIEKTTSTELPRYSDKYRPQEAAQPTLKKKDLNPDFFPPALFEAFFNPRKKQGVHLAKKRKLDLNNLGDEEDPEGKGSEDGSNVGSEVEEDYDVDEEDDNDYAENYFDNGEADDLDDLVTGEDVGGGGDVD